MVMVGCKSRAPSRKRKEAMRKQSAVEPASCSSLTSSHELQVYKTRRARTPVRKISLIDELRNNRPPRLAGEAEEWTHNTQKSDLELAGHLRLFIDSL